MKNILAALSVTFVMISLAAEAQLNYSNTDFQSLFNQYRVAQAKVLPWPGTYWPFEGHDGGSGINHVPPGQTQSPAEKYDDFFATGGKAAKWEEKNHTCKGVDASELHDCQVWYGHCNGWTGAALFNPEPDYDKVFSVTGPNGTAGSFNFVDIKALLSEVWLDVSVTYEGTGTTENAGKWIFDPNAAMSKKASDNDSTVSNYEAYWDVSPRALFYALTNYIGQQGIAIAMDRFTAAEIWNQPVMGYRLLPITGNTTNPVQQDGQTLYPVTLGVKIYWANDDIPYDFRRTSSLNWNITDPVFSTDKIPSPPGDPQEQDQVADDAVNSRYISFTLFFDAPVSVSEDGKQILSAGKIIGDGVWTHADPDLQSIWYAQGFEQSQTHPDFLWRPDALLLKADSRNPHIDPELIYKYILQIPIPSVQ